MNDLKFTFRQLLKNPGFAAVAVLTLALGIGATAAVCSLIQGVLLTPSLYRKPEQLILITPESLDRRRHGRGLYGKQWLEWQKKAKSFEAVAGYAWGFCFLLLPGGSESLQGLAVTSDYFRVLGIQPALGRTFVDADGDPFADESSPSVIILGHTLWQRSFNGDPSIIGRSIQLRRNASPPVTFTARVVGVMPPGIRFLPAPNEDDPNYDVDAQADYWFPLPTIPKWSWWSVAARLRDGTKLSQTQAELTAIAARQAQADRDLEGMTVRPNR